MRRALLEPSPLQKYTRGEFRRESHHHLSLISLGGDGFEENYVFVFGPVESERVLELAERFFDPEEYSVIIESGASDDLGDYLRTQQWLIDEDEPSMILAPVPPIPSPPAELVIKTVTTQETFVDFMRISETGHRWVPSVEAATDPDVCLLVGYLDGEPVATSRVSLLGDIGEVSGVVTDPGYRRRGFGTAMTWAAVAAGVERGAVSIILSASDQGYPIYLKMGFVPVCSYRTYVNPSHLSNKTSEAQERARTDS